MGNAKALIRGVPPWGNQSINNLRISNSLGHSACLTADASEARIASPLRNSMTAAYCNRCSMHVPEGMSACRMCGNALLVAPPVAPDGPMLSNTRRRPPQPEFSKWLFFVGLSLVVTPALRIIAIVQKEVPALFGDDSQSFLAQYPGLDKLLYFEIGMNALLVLAALILNFLFYAKRKNFPNAMIGYVAITLIYLITVSGMIHSMFPDAIMAQSAYSLVRYLLWGMALAGYLLFNPDVKARFVN